MRKKIDCGLANTDMSAVRTSSSAWIGASSTRISRSETACGELTFDPTIQPWSRYTPTTSTAPRARIVPATIAIVPSSRS